MLFLSPHAKNPACLRPRPTRLLAGLLVAALLLPALPAANAAPADLPPLGMDTASISKLQAAGAAPRYASYWVGPWMATSGWGGLDNALRTAKATGTTPVLYWYYWGDDISASCVQYGCAGKTRAQWDAMTTTLASRIRTEMGGAEVLVVLENEFNKGDIAGWYAPTFDAMLEGKAIELKGVPGVRIVLGFGAWGESSWTKFPRAAAQSEYIGFQMMRASTRHTEAQYRDAAGQVAYYSGFIATKFNKPSFLYDLALSSYPDASWERAQAETLSAIFDGLVSAGQTGLQGVIYRSLRDTYMDPKNYFGAAESHWGLQYGDGRGKPAWDVWKARATASPTPSPPPAANVPGAFEAEATPATAGGRQSDASASGGAVWNLWSNGELRATLHADAPLDARITVVARGQLAQGVAPRMEVRLGSTLLGTFDVPAGGLGAYAVDATVPAGESHLRVLFTNDVRTTTEDRNLILDVLRVEPRPTNRAPVADFAWSASGLTVSVDGSSSSDPDGDALTYAWDLGDGTTATGATATHTYASGGDHAVTLVVSDGKADASQTRTVTVVRPNAPPTATFTTSGSDLSWSFDARGSSDPDGDALTYAWDLGDGTTATGPTATHTYAAAGDHAVTLVVSDGKANASHTRTVTAVRPNAPPTATFTTSGSDLTWSFDARGSSDPDGDALTYAWDLGDGTTATGHTVSRTYATAGDRTVKLTVTDARGLSSEAKTLVRATAPPPPPPPPSASFSPRTGNEWWVQVGVSGSGIVKVDSRDTGGAWTALTLRSWGDWAGSYHVEPGHRVQYRATLSDGRVVESCWYTHPGTSCAPPPLTATFTPYGGNEWWVQTRVDASAPLKSVCASVNGGACQPLSYRSWGAWANSFHAPAGSKVVFTATSTDGQVARSAAYTWPVR